MKKQLILTIATVSTVLAFPACTTVHEDNAAPATHTSTTSTSESVVHRPVSSTAVESTTVRSY